MNYIYRIINQINGKSYIGLTTKTRPTDRYSQHKYLARHPAQDNKNNPNSAIHAAMRKYGVDNFIFKIIEEVPEDQDLNLREKYWIEFYHTYIKDPLCNGYNLTEGGEGSCGYSRSQSAEERIKKGKSIKKFYQEHPEAVEHKREVAKKLWENEEYRKKVTESNQKFYAEHPDIFKGKNNPFYGKKHTEESLAKIRKSSASRKLKIAQLDKETLEIIAVHDGVKDAERALGVSHGWISKAAKQNKIAYGYKWKFIEEV